MNVWPGPVVTNKFEPETQAQSQRFRASSDEPQWLNGIHEQIWARF